MKTNQLKVGVILNYFQLILGVVVSIIITPILLKNLGQSEYGVINLASSTMSYLSLITLGIGGAFIKYNISYRARNDIDGVRKLNSTFLLIYIVMAAIMAVVGTGLVFASDKIFGESLTAIELEKTKTVMAITVANMAICLPFSVFTMNINAYEKFIFGKSIGLINTVLNPMIRLPIVLMGGLSISITIATTALHIVTCLIEMIYALKVVKVKFKFSKPDSKLLKPLFAFSFFIFLNQIIDLVNWNIDKFILGVVSGTSMVAIYSVGMTFNQYTMSFSTAISGVMTPKVHKIIASGGEKTELQSLFNRTGRIQFVLVAFILTAFSFFGKSFIMNFYADESYKDSYYIALLLIIPLIVPLVQNIGIEVQRALNKHKFRSIVYIGMALVNLAISIPLAKVYGGIGAAIGTCCSLVIGNGIIMNIYYHKACGLNVLDFWWQLLKFIPSLIAPIIFGVCLMLFVEMSNIGVFIGCAIAYTLVYGISVYFLGMNKYEKDLAKKPIKKLLKLKSKESNKNNENNEAIDNNNAIVAKADCCGCKACEQACPTKAITMVTDSEGFWYPYINRSLCINCGLCDKVCNAKNKYAGNAYDNIAYACINKNEDVRLNSSSGGVYYELAKLVIAQNGVVFGAQTDENMRVFHSYAETLNDCLKYRGSKYVQSDIGSSYKEVKEFLNANRKVLFTGTPCQIDGLKLYLQKDYANLIAVDLICHGVPSPKVLVKYVSEIEAKSQSKVVKINFRDKREGWKTFTTTTDSGQEFCADLTHDTYLRLFLSDINLRPSCYNCASKGTKKRADITLADFWGVQDIYPQMFDDKGTSLVLINSSQGEEIFNNIKDNFNYLSVDIDKSVAYNPSLNQSSKVHKYRQEFFDNFDKYSLKELDDKYVKDKLPLRLLKKAKRVIKKIIGKFR